MSKCCCNNDSKYFQNPNAGICDICNPSDKDPLEVVGTCPPVGTPREVTLMAPVVFDESGINLCRVVSSEQLVDVCQNPSTARTTDILFDGLTRLDLENATNLQLQVVDIDFNFVCPKSCRYSEMRPVRNTPNATRVILKDIDVTFAVKVLDANCRVCKEGMMTLRYLPSENCPGYDEETNPSNVALDLYTPYGVSFAAENPSGCNKLVPTIDYVGYISNDSCTGCKCDDDGQPVYQVFDSNNGLSQGISAQALAKVIAADDDCLAIGLTLYFKVVYFVQYKFCHEGICVPPKFAPTANTESSSCLEFCRGDLLEQTIAPLNVCVEPKTTGCRPVQLPEVPLGSPAQLPAGGCGPVPTPYHR